MPNDRKKVFVTDCEGPITRNDNAAELADAFIPRGDEFFRRISLYDDYLAEIVRKPGYKAGDTLRLILPFFKAFGLDQKAMTDFSRQNIEIIPEADTVLQEILSFVPAYIVSTSYSPYVLAVCDAIGFPFGNAFCTAVNLDEYDVPSSEKQELERIHDVILDLPEFSLPADARGPDDLAEEDKLTLAEFDRIFWDQLPKMTINKIIEEVNPIGGREKANAVRIIAEAQDVALSDVMYVGDSITDVDAFRLVKAAEGVTISFNGNHWAVREAAFAVTAQNAYPLAWLTRLFVDRGPEAFQDLTMSEVGSHNVEQISAFSSRVRKEVRTEKIGRLG
jgi:predicted HAD superfamily phosphohydrolase